VLGLGLGFGLGAQVGMGTPAPAWAQGDGEVAKLRADVARLTQELREQRQLILQLVQIDEQRYGMLLKIIQSGGGGQGAGAAAGGGVGAVPALPALPSLRPGGAPSAPAESGGPGALNETGTISGRVRAPGNTGEIYAYVDGLKSAPVRNRTLEIKQVDKRFSPTLAVAQVGTRVLFTNNDTVLHNVFSTTPGNAFDLGTVRGGDKPEPVVLTKPGPVEVYCNIHSKMRVDLLVVANPHWTKVNSDGTFQIPNVPVGTRKVSLWGPGLAPTSQRVEITAKGGSVSFSPEAAAPRAHLNKQGQAYGSYGE
jgi:plastocyanin